MPTNPNSRRNQKVSAVRLDANLIQRLEDFQARQVVRPSRTRVIEVALARFLDTEDKNAANRAA